MGILEVLTIVFIVLKLVGVITWSWWAVTAPLWAGYSIIIAFWALVAVIGATFGSKR